MAAGTFPLGDKALSGRTTRWTGFLGSAVAEQFVNGELQGFATNVHPGFTLVRTIGHVNLTTFVNAPHFPPLTLPPFAFGFYQFTNESGEFTSGPPNLEDFEAEWVWHQGVQMLSGFGVTSAVQSDLVYSGSVYFDSNAQRVVEVDFPTIRFQFGAMLNAEGGGFIEDIGQVYMTGYVRQLWLEP